MNYSNSFTVNFSYPVLFTRNIFSHSNQTLLNVINKDFANVAFFVDEGLRVHWPDLEQLIFNWCLDHSNRIKLASPIQFIKGGEFIKNDLSIIDHVGHFAENSELCRQSYIVGIGGGAILDAIGFASAIIHRGIRHIRIPTTVLAQLDSGIGLKNSMNRFGQKNFFGTFAPPWAVINDFSFLQTLEQRDWVSGVAEAFKIAIIKDRKFLEYLIENAHNVPQRDQESMEYIITHCANLHMEHIKYSGDPFETGSSKPLDFGHWAAHRLEVLTNFEIRHGEAVSIGIAIDLLCSEQLGLISEKECESVLDAMGQSGLPLWHKIFERNEEIIIKLFKGIDDFKIHQGGNLTITMPHALGTKTEIHTLSLDLIDNSINALEKRKNMSCS